MHYAPANVLKLAIAVMERHPKHVGLVGAATALLGRAAADGAYVEAAIAAGAPTALVKGLTCLSHHVRVTHFGMVGLAFICRKLPAAEFDKVVGAGIVQVALTAIEKHGLIKAPPTEADEPPWGEDIAQAATEVLALLTHCVAHLPAMRRAGVLPALVAALKANAGDRKLAVFVCCTCWVLTRDRKGDGKLAADFRALLRAGAVPAFAAALQKFEADDVLAEAVCAFFFDVGDLPEGKAALATPEVMAAVAGALLHHKSMVPSENDVVACAVGTLDRISQLPSSAPLFARPRIVPALIAALRSHPVNVFITESVACTLEAAAADRGTRELLARLNLPKELVAVIEHHGAASGPGRAAAVAIAKIALA